MSGGVVWCGGFQVTSVPNLNRGGIELSGVELGWALTISDKLDLQLIIMAVSFIFPKIVFSPSKITSRDLQHDCFRDLNYRLKVFGASLGWVGSNYCVSP